ncbi:hypothetical protein ACOME3_004327 [Neoechinorhynchus agilis]
MIFVTIEDLSRFDKLNLITNCASAYNWLYTLSNDIDFRSQTPIKAQDQTFRTMIAPEADEKSTNYCPMVNTPANRRKLKIASIPLITENSIPITQVIIILKARKFSSQPNKVLFFELEAISSDSGIDANCHSLSHTRSISIVTSGHIHRRVCVEHFNRLWQAYRITVEHVKCLNNSLWNPYYVRFAVPGQYQDIYARKHFIRHNRDCIYSKKPFMLTRIFSRTTEYPVIEVVAPSYCTIELRIDAYWRSIIFNWLHVYGPIILSFMTSSTFFFILIGERFRLIGMQHMVYSSVIVFIAELFAYSLLMAPLCFPGNNISTNRRFLHAFTFFHIWTQDLYDGFHTLIGLLLTGVTLNVLLWIGLCYTTKLISKCARCRKCIGFTNSKCMDASKLEMIFTSMSAFVILMLTVGTFVFMVFLVHTLIRLVFLLRDPNKKFLAVTVITDCLIYILLIIANSPIAIAFLSTVKTQGFRGALLLFDSSTPIAIFVYAVYLLRFVRKRTNTTHSKRYGFLKFTGCFAFTTLCSIVTSLTSTYNIYRLNYALILALTANVII